MNKTKQKRLIQILNNIKPQIIAGEDLFHQINTPKYWENYGYNYIGEVSEVYLKRTGKLGLKWEYIKDLSELPTNYIISIGGEVENGKFGRTKNMAARVKGYKTRGGNRKQDRIQNAMFDAMVEAFNKGKKVELFVRNTTLGATEKINEFELSFLFDVEGFEKKCANKFKEIREKFPKFYCPK